MTEIDQKLESLGGSQGFLGAPIHEERTCPDGLGHFRTYEYGSIHYHPKCGGHETHGAIRMQWESLGWENGVLGYPTSDEQGLSEYDYRSLVDARASAWGDAEFPGWEEVPPHPLDGVLTNPDFGRVSYFQHGAILFFSSNGQTTVLRKNEPRQRYWPPYDEYKMPRPPRPTLLQKIQRLLSGRQ